jgi:hypothetical protein
MPSKSSRAVPPRLSPSPVVQLRLVLLVVHGPLRRWSSRAEPHAADGVFSSPSRPILAPARARRPVLDFLALGPQLGLALALGTPRRWAAWKIYVTRGFRLFHFSFRFYSAYQPRHNCQQGEVCCARGGQHWKDFLWEWYCLPYLLSYCCIGSLFMFISYDWDILCLVVSYWGSKSPAGYGWFLVDRDWSVLVWLGDGCERNHWWEIFSQLCVYTHLPTLFYSVLLHLPIIKSLSSCFLLHARFHSFFLSTFSISIHPSSWEILK